MPPVIATRQAGLDDLDALLANVQAGFDSYVAFAAKGWRPPNVADNRHRSAELLADPATWALIAHVDGGCVGHVAFLPARERSVGAPRGAGRISTRIPGLAHLWQLFVAPEWWGRGVAPLLHDATAGELRAQGYQNARLFTPSLHARARRFYERRGWSAAAEEYSDDLALMLTEYRIVLD